jgi:hypothetical protein
MPTTAEDNHPTASLELDLTGACRTTAPRTARARTGGAR